MRQQRGVALIVALLALVLAVLLATALIDRGEATAARWRDSWRAEQSWQLLRGMEAWAVAGLLAGQRANGKVDSRDEAWAQSIAPIEIPGATLTGRLRDLGGCFNINALASGGVIDEVALARFRRLLVGVKLPPELAEQAADWLDTDATPRQNGAEDAAYGLRRPSGRSGNGPMANASEMLALPAMTAEAWQRLAPLVCALPNDHRINLNTAPVELWLTLDERITMEMARRLVRADAQPYSSESAVLEALVEREGLTGINITGYAIESQYFLAQSEILADGIPFHYSSLLQRLPGRVRVIARARGGFMPVAQVESPP